MEVAASCTAPITPTTQALVEDGPLSTSCCERRYQSTHAVLLLPTGNMNARHGMPCNMTSVLILFLSASADLVSFLHVELKMAIPM
jgi:hypothetical protein